MVGTPRRTPRAVLRALLWTLGASFGVALTVLAGGAASAATHADDGDAPTPVGDLVANLTGGAATPLTDALAPVAQPVERATAPVTQPATDTARSALTGGGASAPGPDRGGPTAPTPDRGPTQAAPERFTAAGGDTGGTPSTVPAPGHGDAAAGPQVEPGHGKATDRDRDAGSDQGAPSRGESVDVGDLDFGPRSFPSEHGDHGTATAPVSASVVALDDAEAPHVGRDDLLTAVLVPHDTNRRTQNFTRPDVSPG
ncbi:hypothetical protein [Aeromicrobium sp.]|uniref:hypothetical protein n=1 Tax=Aeromicrobium sp. TaxID=1871063 RepID=UPI004034DCDE